MSLQLLALFFAISCALTTPAYAGDGGELSVRLLAHNEIAFLRDPEVAYNQTTAASAVYIPRFGGQIAYGVTHWLEIHVGGALSLPREVLARGVSTQGISGNLLADYHDVLLPMGFALKWDRGKTFNAVFSAAAGPVFFHWREKDLEGLGNGIYDIVKGDTWHEQWFVQTQLVGQCRLSDWFALSVGPYALRKSGGDLHVGLTCTADFMFGFGPHF